MRIAGEEQKEGKEILGVGKHLSKNVVGANSKSMVRPGNLSDSAWSEPSGAVGCDEAAGQGRSHLPKRGLRLEAPEEPLKAEDRRVACCLPLGKMIWVLFWAEWFEWVRAGIGSRETGWDALVGVWEESRAGSSVGWLGDCLDEGQKEEGEPWRRACWLIGRSVSHLSLSRLEPLSPPGYTSPCRMCSVPGFARRRAGQEAGLCSRMSSPTAAALWFLFKWHRMWSGGMVSLQSLLLGSEP